MSSDSLPVQVSNTTDKGESLPPSNPDRLCVPCATSNPNRISGRSPAATREQVAMIKRAAKARRALTNRALAKRFNLSVNIVNNIASGWEPKRYQRARVDS